MRRYRRAVVLTAAIALAGNGLLAAPASADEHPRVEVIAEGLNNPRGITVGADGTVYVAEAGTGGDDGCITVGEGDDADELCFGDTSTITRIATNGAVSDAVTGLPSYLFGEGEVIGAADVAVAADGTLFIAVGLGGDSDLRDAAAAEFDRAAMFGTVQSYDGATLNELADLAQWEADNDPDAGQPSTQGPQGQPSNDSNPNGLLLASDGTLYAVDAGGNAALEIDRETGDVTLRGLFADRFADAPPFLGLPAGTQLPMQAVPTNLAESPTGQVVVSELTGFPFPVGGAQVRRLTATTTPAVAATGFTNAMGLAYVGSDLFVLELTHTGLLSGSFEGSLVRVRADGTRTLLLRDVLSAPGGIAVGPDDMLYITNQSVGPPGSGSVIRFDPAQAGDPAIQSACPPLEVAGTALSDILGTTHEEAITCAAWHGLVAGFADGTFGPARAVTRGQFATTVANLVAATGTELPSGPGAAFSDVDGTTHAASINALAAAEVISGFADGTFRPGASITRAQAVTILVGAYELMTGAALPAGPDSFTDVGMTHRANVNAAAQAGWVRGTSATTFAPAANIQRGQVASMLVRMAADLVDGEFLELPS